MADRTAAAMIFCSSTGASGFVGSAIAIARARRAIGFACWCGRRARESMSSPVTRWSSEHVRPRVAGPGAQAACAISCTPPPIIASGRPPADDIMRTNVDGTRIIMQEALRAGVERIVYTSSVATMTLRGRRPGRREPTDCRSRKGSALIRAARSPPSGWSRPWSRSEDLPAVIVNPSTPIGPRDVKPTPTGRIIVEAARGRMPGFVDTGLNLVHVDDVAEGHLAALRCGRIGERYILGGEKCCSATCSPTSRA